MATTQGSGAVNNQGAFVYTWPSVPTGNVGNGVDISAFMGPVSVQVEGTIGTGSYGIQGSNDGTNWETLKDINGTALSALTALGVFSIGTRTRYVRPNIAGTGSTLSVTLVAYPD